MSVRECDVVYVELELVDPNESVIPYSTILVAFSSVVHVIVAVLEVTLLDIDDIFGAVLSTMTVIFRKFRNPV